MSFYRLFSFPPQRKESPRILPSSVTTAKLKTFPLKVGLGLIKMIFLVKDFKRSFLYCTCFAGEGQLIALELVSVSGENELPVIGEVHDLTAQHCVRFSSCNPHSVQQKKITIRNNV